MMSPSPSWPSSPCRDSSPTSSILTYTCMRPACHVSIKKLAFSHIAPAHQAPCQYASSLIFQCLRLSLNPCRIMVTRAGRNRKWIFPCLLQLRELIPPDLQKFVQFCSTCTACGCSFLFSLMFSSLLFYPAYPGFLILHNPKQKAAGTRHRCPHAASFLFGDGQYLVFHHPCRDLHFDYVANTMAQQRLANGRFIGDVAGKRVRLVGTDNFIIVNVRLACARVIDAHLHL